MCVHVWNEYIRLVGYILLAFLMPSCLSGRDVLLLSFPPVIATAYKNNKKQEALLVSSIPTITAQAIKRSQQYDNISDISHQPSNTTLTLTHHLRIIITSVHCEYEVWNR